MTSTELDPRLGEALSVIEALLPAGSLAMAGAFAVSSAAGLRSPVQGVVIAADSVPLAVVGCVPPGIAVDTPALLEFLALKARAQRAAYLVAWNLRDATLRETPKKGIPVSTTEPLRRYVTMFDVPPPTESPLPPLVRLALQGRAEEILRDLATLHRDGQLDMVVPDATFFVERLTKAVEILKPHLKEALQFEIRYKVQFGRELERWAIEQGIPADLRSDDFLEAITRQAIYRLLGKVIFYQSLRRSVRSLPELELTGVDSSYVMPRLRIAFAEALKVDYHAVFAEVLIDRIPYPQAAASELAALITDLNTRDFAGLPQDVVGQVFELPDLLGDVAALRVPLRGHRHVLPQRHADRAGHQAGHAGREEGGAGTVRGGHAQQQGGGGDDAVVRAEHHRPQPTDAVGVVPLAVFRHDLNLSRGSAV